MFRKPFDCFCSKVTLMPNLLSSFVLASILALSGSPVQAAEYEFHFTPPAPPNCAVPNSGGTGLNGRAGYLTEMVANFNAYTQEFTYNVTFKPCEGRIPDGYWAVINNGPMPKNHPGEYAVFYFDATDISAPVVTVYGYNGQNGPTSYFDGDKSTAGNQVPDRIVSSLIDNSFVHHLSATDNADGSRSFNLTIDATDIKTHLPLYPDPVDPWYGLGLDLKIGYWLHTVSNLETEYCGPNDSDPVCQLECLHHDIYEEEGWTVPAECQGSPEGRVAGLGFLKHFAPDNQAQYPNFSLNPNHGWYDKTNQQATGNPICIKSDSASVLSIGDTFVGQAKGIGPVNKELTVTYKLPDGATATPPDGTTAPGKIDVVMQWTPTILDAGKGHALMATFTDENGGSTSCGFKLYVPENQPPVCDLVASNTVCPGLGETTPVTLDGSGSYDPNKKVLSYLWSKESCSDPLAELIAEDCELKGCTADLNKDGKVDVSDLLILLAAWGKTNHEADLNGDGTVDEDDLLILLGAWGPCPVYESCGSSAAQLNLFDPGLGIPADCVVQLTVFDGIDYTSCSVNLEVDPCHLECPPPLEFDQCGVCAGPGLNECGTCSSEDVDLGCGCNQPAPDECGTCDGSITADQCGVCGGDGESCLGCLTFDVTPLLFGLDHGAFEQLQLNRRVSQMIIRNLSNRINGSATITLGGNQRTFTPARFRQFGRRLRNRSMNQYDKAWHAGWSLPQSVTNCDNSLFCADFVDSTSVTALAEYEQSVRRLNRIARRGIRTANRMNRALDYRTRMNRRLINLRKRAAKLRTENLNLANSIPLIQSDCS